MKRNEILKELIGAPEDEEHEDFDDNIFQGAGAYGKADLDLLHEDSDNDDVTKRGKYRVDSAFLDNDLEEAYQGKVVSRQSVSKNYSNSIDVDDESIESDSDVPSDEDFDKQMDDDSDAGDGEGANEDFEDGEEEEEDDDDIDGDVDDKEGGGGSGASSIEDDLESDEEGKPLGKDFDVYSKNVKNVSDNKKKGNAILKQQELWESLLENRIIMQKCLVAANKLPVHSEFPDFQAASENEMTEKMNKCCDSLSQVLEKLLQFQNKLFSSSAEFKKTSKMKIEDNKDSGDLDQTPVKKRKLSVYADLLSKQHEDYETYQNKEIQKWNDQTKISSGKFSSSNFSAFDLPTLKQIEQILSDKPRLLRRTQTKRSQYTIYSLNHKDQMEEDEDINPEIFDDDDFYHKLLRDLIERKSVNVTDASRLGKQWIQLQKLRSKMKKKVDTRASKGRKLRFIVHPKLVNFMAPIESEETNEDSAKELYSSLFGRIKV